MATNERICTCSCHVDGTRVRHVSKCCNYAGKYIDKDYWFDDVRYAEIVNKSKAEDEMADKTKTAR